MYGWFCALTQLLYGTFVIDCLVLKRLNHFIYLFALAHVVTTFHLLLVLVLCIQNKLR